MIERFEKFSLGIISIFNSWNEIASREMKKYGFKGICALYLVLLDNSEEGITAAQLAKTCGRDKAEVSRSLSAFKKNGWIAIKGSDKYRALLTLSNEGRRIASAIEERALKVLKAVGDEIPEDKKQAMYECLGFISTQLKILSKDGLPQ